MIFGLRVWRTVTRMWAALSADSLLRSKLQDSWALPSACWRTKLVCGDRATCTRDTETSVHAGARTAGPASWPGAGGGIADTRPSPPCRGYVRPGRLAVRRLPDA